MAFYRLASADDLPIPDHHRPAVDAFIDAHRLCEHKADAAHQLAEHAITVAWVNRPSAWAGFDLGQFHETTQYAAYPELFHHAVHAADIRRVEALALRVQAALDATGQLAGRPADPTSRWTAVLDSEDMILSITVATGDLTQTPEDHLRDAWGREGTVIDIDAPDLYSAFADLLRRIEDGNRSGQSVGDPRSRPPKGPAAPYRRWTAVLDPDDVLVSIAVASGGALDEHFQYVEQYTGSVYELDADNLYTAFAQLLHRIRETAEYDDDFMGRYAAEQGRKAAARAAEEGR
ncbi:hypothetical protein [Kitasatospora purpeofusca]|uniref:hypothetical protein n=1 Tax=Kitasatospora purpeofusca TaxID=67352 RepID=UPI00380C138E